jgi:hypothetical protein
MLLVPVGGGLPAPKSNVVPLTPYAVTFCFTPSIETIKAAGLDAPCVSVNDVKTPLPDNSCDGYDPNTGSFPIYDILFSY